jgi:predicted deacylase
MGSGNCAGMTHALAPYPTPEARDDHTRELARALSAEIRPFGQSVEGRPLLAVRVPAVNKDAPKALITGNIHGVEWISSQVVLGVLESLATGEAGTYAGRLHERAEIWAVPCLNPDGYARTFVSEGHGSLAGLRTNANGVDLNRNFPLPAGQVRKRLPGAGSSVPGKATYVGTGPLSEPESLALEQLLLEQTFHAGVNGHSFMGKVIPARTIRQADSAVYKRLCHALAKAQPFASYGRLASPWFDTFTGELEDHQHHAHRMWAVCLETFSFGASVRQHVRAPSLFWRFNPRERQPWIENDVAAVCAFLLAALDETRPGV